jgi:hypothetical protein
MEMEKVNKMPSFYFRGKLFALTPENQLFRARRLFKIREGWRPSDHSEFVAKAEQTKFYLNHGGLIKVWDKIAKEWVDVEIGKPDGYDEEGGSEE